MAAVWQTIVNYLEEGQKKLAFENVNVPADNDIYKLNELFGIKLKQYPDESLTNIAVPRGAEDYEDIVKSGNNSTSLINKIHIVKLAGIPANDNSISAQGYIDTYIPKTAADLCQTVKGMVTYDAEDFLYCKWVGVPINRLITLRRFPVPVIDNIFDVHVPVKYKDGVNKGKQEKSKVNDVGDIARMVTYMTAETNKMEDILSISYALKWKQLTAEFDQMSSFGEQSGVSGFIKKVAAVFDSTTNSNYVSGRSTGGPMASYDPKFDQNRVYGPVDSIAETHIRDIGLEFNKEFEITFDYELRSINGRTPEYAMKDLIGNILACTFNDGNFWPGARYWVGERPSPWAKKLQWMNSGNIDTVMAGMFSTLKNTLQEVFKSKESALNTLKKAIKGGFALAMGKLLDGLGRPGIPAMQSLLSANPVGNWHLMVGNPHNPILSIGNLMCTGTDIKFPTDSLGYGDFPTKLQVIVRLKPGMPKDKAGIETMFNHGLTKMYWQPVKQKVTKNSTSKANIIRTEKVVNAELTNTDITRQLNEAYKFMPYEEGKEIVKNIELEIGGKLATLEGSVYDEYIKVNGTADDKTKKTKENSDKKTTDNKQNNAGKEADVKTEQDKKPDNTTVSNNQANQPQNTKTESIAPNLYDKKYVNSDGSFNESMFHIDMNNYNKTK